MENPDELRRSANPKGNAINLAYEASIDLGLLTIEPALRLIRHEGGAEEVLEPRIMQVLVALIRANGQILTRDALTARCWDGVVVGEDAISRVIGRLRRLSEGIGRGCFQVETITKVGYRLISASPATEVPTESIEPVLADYARAVGHATSLLHRFADGHPTDPLAGEAQLLADRLAESVGEGAAPQARPSAAPRPLSGPEAGWAEIEASFDSRDYADFLEVYPQSEQAFEARRRKRRLEDWAGTDQRDPAAVTAFLRSGAFAALQAIVQATADTLAGAAERSRLLSIPTSAKASEARAAAVAKRAVLARSFVIGLRGVSTWPRPVMVAIPPGRFTMGSPDTEERWEGYDGEEEPQHDVEIDHVFALGRGAVTLDAFSAFMADTNHDMGESAFLLNGGKWKDTPGRGWRDPAFAQGGDHPVTCVSWHDAQAFIAWLNARLRLSDRPDAYRLPSEAEWEYAWAGTQTPFSFGAAITTDQANFNGTAGYGGVAPSMVWRKATTPVGRFAANAFGLYDMHGDTWDWCEDACNKTYEGAPTDGAPWRTGASLRVIRGGSWDNAPDALRSACRLWYNASIRGSFIGFRLARTLSPPAS